MWPLFTFTLTAGVVAAFNPCGFAMLPAYLGYFIGQESDEETNAAKNVVRGLTVGLTITAGFVTFFSLIGLVTRLFISEGAIAQHIPKVTFGFGILMVPLGIAMLFGYEPKLNIPRLQKGGKSRGYGSIFMFGVSYAAVSLSCTAPIFFGSVIGSFTRDGFVEGLIAFVAYALGMGLVVMILTTATSLARNEIATFFRKALPLVNRVSGVLLFFAGIFLIFYGWWEIQVLRGNFETSPLIDISDRFQGTITNWLADIGGLRMSIAVILILGGLLLAVFRSSMDARTWMAGMGGLATLWLLGEVFSDSLFGNNADRSFELLVLPVLRTIISIPERVGNWFTHTARWETLGEVTFTLIVGTIAPLRGRHLARGRRDVPVLDDVVPTPETVSV